MRVIRIGRDLCNDYVVSHPMVSGFHAELHVYDNGALQLVEHSTNGTYVNSTFIRNEIYNLNGGEVLFFPGTDPVPVWAILGSATIPPAENEEIRRIRSGMNFGDTLIYFFDHYADFKGRARRREYWLMFLWNLIFNIIPFVNILWWLGTFIPNLALGVRRLHDIGKSGWCWLLGFIPLVGPIILFVWELTDSDASTNEYGPSPKYYGRAKTQQI